VARDRILGQALVDFLYLRVVGFLGKGYALPGSWVVVRLGSFCLCVG
jgi:hypothetical protein